MPNISLALLGFSGSASGIIGTTPEPEDASEGLGSGVAPGDLFWMGDAGFVDELWGDFVFEDDRDFGVLESASSVDFFSFSNTC